MKRLTGPVVFVFMVAVCTIASSAGEKPRVLLLGDSISIGYTAHVQELLKNQAVVRRPMRDARRPENCSGTTYGITRIDDWLKIDGGKWDVIHFNWGLHDLKRVDPETKKNSNKATDPHQAAPDVYEKQLRKIVAKLRATGAKLIFATTTPVPEGGVKPYRGVQDVVRYNKTAKQIMAENEIAVDDLYSRILPELKQFQKPKNVHFTPEGSRFLAKQVARSITSALPSKR